MGKRVLTVFKIDHEKAAAKPWCAGIKGIEGKMFTTEQEAIDHANKMNDPVAAPDT